MFRWLALAGVAVILASCATPYAEESFIGGVDVKDLGQDVYRVGFHGNGYTTKTAQTYWLYRSAELALEKGFTGFEILSDVPFVMRQPPIDGGPAGGRPNSVATSGPMPVSPNEVANAPVSPLEKRDEGVSGPIEGVRVAAMVPIFIPSGGGVAHPSIEGDVHLIRRPVEPQPPKLFNAAMLKAKLEPIVKAGKCGIGNICPHVHEYLLPEGKLR